MPVVVRQAQVSDKTLHFVAYFVLVFLFWGAVKPYEKVNWFRPTVWWVLVVVVWYGAMDEWLQGFVRGRTVDRADFFTDLVASLACLLLLTFISFWPALLLVCGVTVLAISICANTEVLTLPPIMHLIFHIGLHSVFTILWVLFLARRRRDRRAPKVSLFRHIGPSAGTKFYWVIAALSLPLALLMIKLGALGFGHSFTLSELAGSGLAVVGWVALAGVIGLVCRPVDKD